MGRWILAAAALAAVLAIGWQVRGRAPPAAPTFVGSAQCASCHEREAAAWRGSQHAHAMQKADAATVLGDFGGARFEHAGVRTTFSTRDGAFVVNTDGPDGKPADFAVDYVFGLAPLQQYLLGLPGGRLQALGLAWDARPGEQGGQRWFHLYPDDTLAAGDPLHWTGIDQNWNYQCADCHSTNLRKNYDAATRSYRTAWSEISVGCEACHGPGSAHAADPALAPSVALDGREIETCAQCHSHREQFADARPAAFLDAYRPSLLEPGLYFADGQMRDEVYNYGSFLQSRMAASGVTCSNCHEPHAGALRAPGNAVCAQCHAPQAFDAKQHHHHEPGSAGAQCAACHMPARTYMGVDARHDHSFRIPRPDRSVTLGTPNACEACHAKEGAEWAAATVLKWYPLPKPGFQTFAEAFDAADRGAPEARDALLAVLGDAALPPLVRASALQRLAPRIDAKALAALEAALRDASPLVRSAAAQACAFVPPEPRARMLAPLLDDGVRLVRMDAARALAGDAERALGPRDLAALGRALDEYLVAQRFNADRPGAQVNIGNVLAARGDAEGARAAYEEARRIDPTFSPAAVNLADLHRAAGDEARAAMVLRESLARTPRDAALHHALGLALVRGRQMGEALDALGRAAELDPGNARYAYAWALALDGTGQGAAALRALEAAHARYPADREILEALVRYETRAGQAGRAQQYRQLLHALD